TRNNKWGRDRGFDRLGHSKVRKGLNDRKWGALDPTIVMRSWSDLFGCLGGEEYSMVKSFSMGQRGTWTTKQMRVDLGLLDNDLSHGLLDSAPRHALILLCDLLSRALSNLCGNLEKALRQRRYGC